MIRAIVKLRHLSKALLVSVEEAGLAAAPLCATGFLLTGLTGGLGAWLAGT